MTQPYLPKLEAYWYYVLPSGIIQRATKNKDRPMTSFLMTWKAHDNGTLLLVWGVGGTGRGGSEGSEQVVEGRGRGFGVGGGEYGG